MSHDQLRVLMEHGEEMGCINMSAFTALVQELELDDEELNGLYEQIEGRGIELTDDCALPEVAESTYVNGEVAASRSGMMAGTLPPGPARASGFFCSVGPVPRAEPQRTTRRKEETQINFSSLFR